MHSGLRTRTRVVTSYQPWERTQGLSFGTMTVSFGETQTWDRDPANLPRGEMNTDTQNIPSVLCPGALPGLAPEDTFLDCLRPVATTCLWGPHRRSKVNPVASQFWLHLRNAKCRLAPKQQHPSIRAAKPGACPRAHTLRPGHLEAWAGLQRHTEESPEGPPGKPGLGTPKPGL